MRFLDIKVIYICKTHGDIENAGGRVELVGSDFFVVNKVIVIIDTCFKLVRILPSFTALMTL